jgi:hypothetical protein
MKQISKVWVGGVELRLVVRRNDGLLKRRWRRRHCENAGFLGYATNVASLGVTDHGAG